MCFQALQYIEEPQEAERKIISIIQLCCVPLFQQSGEPEPETRRSLRSAAASASGKMKV